jgi:acetoacetyl-CoA synthetase
MSRPDAGAPLWSPSPERVASANLTAYAAWLQETRGVRAPDYAALWQWSVDELEAFWATIWERFDVQADGSPVPVLASREMPGAAWFPNARLNYAEHLFRGRDPQAPAIHHASELRPLAEWSWGELAARTAAIAGGLRALGVEAGDRVVAYLPNLPETLAAFLATASLGAVWSSCSPDFGARTVVDRFAQIEPKVLLAVDGYRYGGRDFDRREVVRGIAAQIPSLEHVVTLGHLDGSGWAAGFEDPSAELSFTRVPFDQPLWVLYSSGTTGLPKAIVHGHGGILLEQLKHAHLHLDAHAGDRVFWFTTTGWMMWNFLVGVLLTDAEIVLYDGNPAHPGLETLWQLAADARVTVFGTSAAFIAGCLKAGVHPAQGRDLSALRAVGSTGSPLASEGFRWVYDELGPDTWLFSTSGGTDVCTAFVGGVPTLPVHEGELQGRALGCDVQAWDEDGRALSGEVGELTIRQPMPSMPVFLWNDRAAERYRDAYFDTYPGVWRHGDWIEITDRGTAVISGRSDSTINRGGVRMGTAEIYRAVLALDEIVDALVVDLPLPGHEEGWMPLFVVLREGVPLDDELTRRIAQRIRIDCSPRHVPNEVRVVAEVPRTLSGKVLEVPVKRILMGQDPDRVLSRGSLANPAALQPFIELAARIQVAASVSPWS